MKKLMALILAGACLLSLAGCSSAGEKPYKDLTAEEISSATVYLAPPDTKLRIEDMDELATLLQSAVIYDKDDSYTDYAGQAVIFSLTMTDGTQTEIMAYNPFLVIDGVGYKTEYEPCEALNAYANSLLDRENASVILEKPPALTVVSDQTAMEAMLGTYSWERAEHDGTVTTVTADSAHPLDCEDLLSPLETAEATAALVFAEKPDAIRQARCWSDAHWGDTDADSEEVPVHADTIELKAGGYIYEIAAQWNTDSGCGGTASYFIYIKADR